MLCYLVRKCRISLSYPALRMIVHYWEDVPASSGAAEGLLINYLLHHPSPLSIASGILAAIRAEIKDRQKKKSTVHLEEGEARFSHFQLLLLNHIQETMRGMGGNQGEILQRMLSILDATPTDVLDSKGEDMEDDDNEKAPEKPARKKAAVLSHIRPLRVAFADDDSAFMSSPLVETYTRLAWMGQEYVMVSCCAACHTTL